LIRACSIVAKYLHRHADKTQLRKCAGPELQFILLRDPSVKSRMVRRIRMLPRQQGVYIEQDVHGKSAKAALISSSATTIREAAAL
jgi:hypothetical protein